MKINVNSIFDSIDGEVNGFGGAGELCTFVRLQGCNLRCPYCDTKYAQGGDYNQMLTADEIFRQVHLNKVTITGGEPLLQRGALEPLIIRLISEKKRVTIETNGTIGLPKSWIMFRYLRFVMDFKLPSSGMFDDETYTRAELLSREDVVKFVIADREDFFAAVNCIQKLKLNKCKARMAFSPMIEDQKDYTGWPSTLAKMMICDKLKDVQFSLQIHKVLWPYAKEER